MSQKTTAQWRREVPAYDQLIRAVESVAARWPAGRAPRMIAHLDPDTQVMSIVLDGTAEQCVVADGQLAGHGYTPGWAYDAAFERPVWRKTVTR